MAARICVVIGAGTSRFHIRHVYENSNVHSKSETVAWALRTGLPR
jgi:hypothetical protein